MSEQTQPSTQPKAQVVQQPTPKPAAPAHTDKSKGTPVGTSGTLIRFDS